MQRKLASIRIMGKITPIKNADNIVLGMVDNWTVVIKKDEIKEGDQIIFYEIDSLLPEAPQYEFLQPKKDYYGSKRYRLKTMKMRGVLSQGLALPLSSFPEHNFKEPYIYEGFDVTELLGVIKYDPEFYTDNSKGPKTWNTSGKFPSYLRKTDQDRIQNLQNYFEYYKEHEFECTLKADGSSFTAGKVNRPLSIFSKVKKFLGLPVKEYHFCVCSRNLELKLTDTYSKTFNNSGKISEYNQSDFWKIAIKLELEKHLPIGFAISGELLSPKIQSNHERVEWLELWVFDVFDISNQMYLLPKERKEFMTTHLSHVDHVPVVHESIKIFTKCPDFNSLQQFVTGKSKNGGISEGMVFKSTTVNDLSFKCISNEYLLKCEK